jgi:uncharacterized protein YndB with AHSA1/START domain
MSTVNAKIEIDAPIEQVWDTIMDPHRFRDWVTIHRSVRDVSQSPVRRVGATMDQSIHVRGVTFHVHWTLIAVDAPNSAEWSGLGPAHSTARIHYALSSSGDHSTLFEYTNEFHPPGGRLGDRAGRLLVGAASEHEAHNSLARLKTLIEKERKNN